ncbi:MULTISPECIES: hypothetical protein [Lysobacter]|jgi:hypothetical protein|uniref:Transmembrane protein n=1 Tax=Lysobacter gummosus TaxID=262324 RepID=A0ABY3XFU9_9GAMM|nr:MULTISPECIES: hypothetical protein [Lysobacter]ALN89927.1 hypothetical protein LG3211_0950 [Lysobacter gummosus]UJB18203.1 hypothetical protein L1A79_17875 [Lysobacter capsici]UJQ28074.1 hypothetical protein L2D09_22010 [Lysobacter gummosus]UNP30516.1 hypothetical protein MOV92_04410 [Lysobacter gummosus]
MNRMLRAAAPPRRAFRTGGHTVLLVAVLYLMALPIAIWIRQDGLRAGVNNFSTEIELALGLLAVLVGLIAAAAVQRVSVDASAGGLIRYANITSGHRGRAFEPHEVVGMSLHRAKDGRLRLTSTLELRLAPSEHRGWTTATIFDGDMSGDGRAEPLATIMRLVVQARPDVSLDANLRALLAARRYGAALDR